MPLPSSGPITLGQVASEFGISASLAACYGIAPGVPTSGVISLANLHGKALPVGQIVLSSGTWTVPSGVSKVSMVTIGGSITRSGEILLSASDAIGTRNDGGGNGGAAPSKGGGGAGGYTGNGGTGGSPKRWNGVSAMPDDSGAPGTGGGGRGGNGGVNVGGSLYYWPGAGYGASLLGLSPGGGTLYGGGGPGDPGNAYSSGAPGANLRYRNNVAVAAGQVLSISGPCRIVWGSNRAFPSTNVGNL